MNVDCCYFFGKWCMGEVVREMFVVSIWRLGVRLDEGDIIGKFECMSFLLNCCFVDMKIEVFCCKFDEVKKSFGDRVCLGILWNCYCLGN